MEIVLNGLAAWKEYYNAVLLKITFSISLSLDHIGSKKYGETTQ